MFIKSVIIDGFKSYGRRTEINGFDPEFTAITGLNGSGKSNILDSICFVMGIMNLTQVRVASLQELVYKSGQAGVTKATVTIIFDNTDPNQRPLGYDKCREISVTRQIVVGGKNKYFINGKIVQNKKVADLFCSVQLNVNNPSFLIMQGRITKVLNMKPSEILSMIEEAAGTSMYESKREATTKLIERKDVKVRETNTLLQEEVEPKLEKLRQEKASYEEFQKLMREIEFLERIYISHRYTKQRDVFLSVEKNVVSLNEKMKLCHDNVFGNDAECERIDETYKDLQNCVDNKVGGALQKLEEELKNQTSMESEYTVNMKSINSIISQEERKLQNLEKHVTSENKTLNEKESKMLKFQDMFKTIKETCEKYELLYKEAQSKYEAITKGFSTNESGESSSLQTQLINAKQELTDIQTQLKSNEMHLNGCLEDLKKKEAAVTIEDVGYDECRTKQKAMEIEMEELNEQLLKTGYENDKLERLIEQKALSVSEIGKLKSQLQNLGSYKYELQYTNPGPSFQKHKLYGMVGKLFNVRDQKYNLALTMAGGGNIYAYVTADDITSKQLIQQGKLTTRSTMIPINKISSYPIKQSVIDYAKNLVGKENVESALSLIEYDTYLDGVMKYVFGNSLICRDMNIAKKVTYDPKIHCRTITLEGDICDPEGTLSGGSRPKGCNVLELLNKIKHIDNAIKSKEKTLSNLQQEISICETAVQKYDKINNMIILHKTKLDSNIKKLSNTDLHQNQKELNELKNNIENIKNKSSQLLENEKNANIKIKNIQEKLKVGCRQQELKEASDAMECEKRKAQAAKNDWKKHEQNFSTLTLEIEEIKKNIEKGKVEQNTLIQNLSKMKIDSEELKSKLSDVVESSNQLKKRIKEQKEQINSQNAELKNLMIKKNKLQKQNQDLKLEIKKKENEVAKLVNESNESKKKIEILENKYSWILVDRDFFGKRNTRYDYSKENPIEAGQKLTKMREQQEKMERTVNLRSMTLLEREEEQYRETMRRKKIVEQDKEKIKNIIVKMDEKKREKVENAWKDVDKNFKSIFSSLLHGAEARLHPVKEGNQLIGLEIKVGFNGVFKDSLSELSGGQRSLVALSLVLAMLKFSPAPLYILDEVDSALDMSHTQNIGNMLHTHFSNSQFIIVSLKDGMFNNANVLFRTKFEEGVSVVTRTVNPRITNR